MFDVVVAGGGIGGLSFALAARAAGLRVCVLERSANVVRANLGGGLGLWPPSQQVLRELGVLPALIARGRYMPPPRYCNHRAQVLGQPTPHFAERFPILCVERSVLLEVLEARCVEAGVILRPACELRSYTVTDADAAPVLLELATPQGVEGLATDLLVGADGIHSRVRSQMLGPDRAVRPQHCGYSYFRSSVPIALRAPDADWHALAFEASASAMCRCASRRCSGSWRSRSVTPDCSPSRARGRCGRRRSAGCWSVWRLGRDRRPAPTSPDWT